jgi:transposase
MDRKPSTSKRYPDELKERAVKMVLDLQRSDPNDHGVIGRVSRQLGIGAESLRSWVKRAQVEAGTRGGMTEAQAAELKDLRKEVRELRRANAILQDAATFFGAALDRQSKR